MKKIKLTKADYPHYYDLFVRFHSGQITEFNERMQAKKYLFCIHYGNYDYTDAMKEALAWKNKNS